MVQQLIEDLAVGGVGRGDGHVGDQLVVGIDPEMRLVPIEGPCPRLVPVAGLDIDGGDQPIPGHLAGDAKHPILAGLDVLAGHQRQQVGSLSGRPIQLVAIQGAQVKVCCPDLHLSRGAAGNRTRFGVLVSEPNRH